MQQELVLEAKVHRPWSQSKILSLVFFMFLLLQAGSLGLSDDEAYYWVLAQKPALGYAFHPPAVAWMISLSQKVFGRFFSSSSVFAVRLPAVLSMTFVFALGCSWAEEVLVSRDFERTAPWVLLSFVGLFGLGWMMVPDVPLFLGWTTAFVSVWRICFARERLRDGFFLGCAVALLMLSKYSGILAAFSGVLCILFWAPRCRKMKAMLWLGFGLIAGMLPTLVWNSQHEWASILYQIRDRHSGASLSMIRWIKFWLIELIFASPVVIGYFFVLCKKNLRMETNSVSQVERFLWVWIWPPAAIFCLQPFFSEFKPHWAFVVWWPVTLGLAVASGSYRKALTWAHLVYGGTLTFFIAFTCHWPWMAQVVPQLTHSPFQMTWDVTNDFYGWSQLKTKMSSSIDPGDLTLPVVGSRYQTASQAAFSLAGLSRVTLIPRDLKEKDEWPDLNISLPQALDWPQLDRAVLFVADNRYSEAPQFKNSRCALLEHFDIFRNGLLSKWIEVWKCFPNNPS